MSDTRSSWMAVFNFDPMLSLLHGIHPDILPIQAADAQNAAPCSETQYLSSGILCTAVMLFLKQIHEKKGLSDELLEVGVTPLKW